MEEEKTDKGFVIKDKRIFDESGETRKEELKKEETRTDAKTNEEPAEKDSKEKAQEEYFPEVTFSSFVFSLSTTVMYHFGDFPDPVTKKAEKNLTAAKQTIDMLNMLKNKTIGNLDENEKELLDGILYELMMRYVKEKAGG
jgi:Pyruvate/2-oxoacid:ferredoxin oxidoreductase gamma subunit